MWKFYWPGVSEVRRPFIRWYSSTSSTPFMVVSNLVTTALSTPFISIGFVEIFKKLTFWEEKMQVVRRTGGGGRSRRQKESIFLVRLFSSNWVELACDRWSNSSVHFPTGYVVGGAADDQSGWKQRQNRTSRHVVMELLLDAGVVNLPS